MPETPRTITFPAVFASGEDGEIIVTFPDFAEAITFGWTEEDALLQAQDCLREALRGRVRDGQDIPEPSTGIPGSRPIRVG